MTYYRIEMYPNCPPRHGFSIICPVHPRMLKDISPISIVRELNGLLRKINRLEKENDALRADLLLWEEKEAKP